MTLPYTTTTVYGSSGEFIVHVRTTKQGVAMSTDVQRKTPEFTFPSIHSLPPFFTQQPNPSTQAVLTNHWARLILSYARHKRIFFLSVEDTEAKDSEWNRVLRNITINRRVLPTYLSFLLSQLVLRNQAAYEPSRQTHSVILYWRTAEEWGDILHNWVTATGQLNTILTFYEITSPVIESELSGLPEVLLKKAIAYLTKTGRAQLIGVADGEGVRFFAGVNR